MRRPVKENRQAAVLPVPEFHMPEISKFICRKFQNLRLTFISLDDNITFAAVDRCCAEVSELADEQD